MEGNRLLEVFRCSCATAATGFHSKFDRLMFHSKLMFHRLSSRCKLWVQSFYSLDTLLCNLPTLKKYKGWMMMRNGRLRRDDYSVMRTIFSSTREATDCQSRFSQQLTLNDLLRHCTHFGNRHLLYCSICTTTHINSQMN